MSAKSWFCLGMMALGIAGAIVGHVFGASTAVVLSGILFVAGLLSV